MRPGLGHAHTLPYDAALIEPYQSGRPLPSSSPISPAARCRRVSRRGDTRHRPRVPLPVHREEVRQEAPEKWNPPCYDDELNHAVMPLLADAGTHLYGRRSYELFAR